MMQNWSTIERRDPIWKKLRTGEIDDIIFDSGGFQAQTGVKTTRVVNKESYALWLELTLREYPNIKYLNLDVFGNNAATLDNQAYFESQGLHPIPIWHAIGNEVPDMILDYLCDRYEYVAIGAIAKSASKSIYKLFEYLMQKYPHTKFHLLGIGLGINNICKIYRPYSADSSTWLAPSRWGRELLFDGEDFSMRLMSEEDRLAIRKNDVVRTMWSEKTIQVIKAFEDHVNNTEPKKIFQVNMFAGETLWQE